MNLLILVVDDEPDVELLFRQQFRHDLRAGRFTMEFATPAAFSSCDFSHFLTGNISHSRPIQ